MQTTFAIAPLDWIDLGRAALYVSAPVVVLACLAAIVGAAGRGSGAPKRQWLVDIARRGFYVTAAALTVAVIGLAMGFLSEGAYDVAYVFNQGDTSAATHFQIASVWAGQNGSILFWAWLLSVYGAVLAFTMRRDSRPRVPWVLTIVGLVQLFFVGAILLLDQNPFVLTEVDGLLPWMILNGGDGVVATGADALAWLEQARTAVHGVSYADLAPAPLLDQLRALGDSALPAGMTAETIAREIVPAAHAQGVPVLANGAGLNPLLANIWIAIHPPAMYVGYIGCAIVFAIGLGGVLGGDKDDWVRDVRPWLLFVWFFLTIGNILGGLWAYEELGWGGFWAWDPVENAAILPWFAATALLHGIVVQDKRGQLRVWNLGLLGATFALTMLGTWITRSGMIDSVHAFALNTQIGAALLTFVAVVLVLTLLTIIGRWRMLRSKTRQVRDSERPVGRLDEPVSSVAAILAGNVVLVIAAMLILGLTLAPLLVWRFGGDPFSTTESFFVTAPFFVLTFFFMAAAMGIGFERLTPERRAIRLWWPLAIGAMASTIALLIQLRFTELDFVPLRLGFDTMSWMEVLHGLVMPLVPPAVFGTATFALVTLALAFHLPAYRAAREAQSARPGATSPPPRSAAASDDDLPANTDVASFRPVEEGLVARKGRRRIGMRGQSLVFAYGRAMLRLVRYNRQRYGGYLVHFGAILLFVGICVATQFKSEMAVSAVPLGGAVTVYGGFPTEQSITYTLRRVELGLGLEGSRAALADALRDAPDEVDRFDLVERAAEEMVGHASQTVQMLPTGEVPLAYFESRYALGHDGQRRARTFDQTLEENILGVKADTDAARSYLGDNLFAVSALHSRGRLSKFLNYRYARMWLEVRLDQPALTLDLRHLLMPPHPVAGPETAVLRIATEAGSAHLPLVARGQLEHPQVAFDRFVGLLEMLLRPQGVSIEADALHGLLHLRPTGSAASLSAEGRDRMHAAIDQRPFAGLVLPSREHAPEGFFYVGVRQGRVTVRVEGDTGARPEAIVLVKPADRLLAPSIRQYAGGSEQITREAAIWMRPFGDDFIVPREVFRPVEGVPGAPATTGFTIHHNPWMALNLLGVAIIVIGTVVAFVPAPRRRVGGESPGEEVVSE